MFGENPYCVRENPLIKEVKTSAHNMQDPVVVPINPGTTSGTAKNWYNFLSQDANAVKKSLPATWDDMNEKTKNNVVRVLITWPELCRKAGISQPKDSWCTLGQIRDDLLGLYGPRYFTLERYVVMHEHYFAPWWKRLSTPSKLVMIKLAHIEPKYLRNWQILKQFI
jgi:hypothetical protein